MNIEKEFNEIKNFIESIGYKIQDCFMLANWGNFTVQGEHKFYQFNFRFGWFTVAELKDKIQAAMVN